MDSKTEAYQKSIFQFELGKLKEKDYLSDEHFEITMNAHNKYCSDLEAKRKERAQADAVVVKEKPAKTAITPVVKKLSTEEIRERNITWLLNVGVILLLISGLFVATSNWDTMASWMKSGSIVFVSLLFYGMAYLASKILKIERTSYAFIVLGSLFLPIFILSVGWFELLGPYFSFYGEGRYILGAAGSFLIVPIYSFLAKKFHSRLFVWFAFIALAAGVGYTLGAFKLEKDGFYLGIMLFNAMLAVAYHRIKNRKNLTLFSNELVYFAQINLVLSTILMLVYFNNHVFYSVNIVVTAAIYLSMIYVTGKEEYHFVFSLLILYGAYQLIENSIFLEVAGPVFYALVGASFLLVPKWMDNQYPWKNVFRITSAAVSILAFLYITAEGTLLKMNEPSAALLLAYVIIAIQFIYLANTMANGLFANLAPIFIASALFEVFLMVDQAVNFNHFILPIFLIGFVLFISFGYLVRHPLINVITLSSRDAGNVIMLFSVLLAIGLLDWLAAGIMLVLFSLGLLLMSKVDKRAFYTGTIPWTIPLATGFAFMFFGEEMRWNFPFYHDSLGFTMNTVLASAVLLFLTFIIKGKKRETQNSFLIAQGFYTIAIFSSIVLPINDVWMRPAVLLGGIAMYLALYHAIKQKWVPFAAAGVSLIAYLSILMVQSELHSQFFVSIQFPFGTWILLFAAFFLLKRDKVLARGFSWVGHIFMPISMTLTLFLYSEDSLWAFGGAVIIYWVSSRVSNREWKVKLFLYSSFFAFFIAVLTSLDQIWDSGFSKYAVLIVSCCLFVFWLFAQQADKERSVYFLIPWSSIGILAFLAAYPFGYWTYFISVLYASGLLVFLHKLKLDLLSGIPLAFIYLGTMKFLFINQIAADYKILVSAALALALGMIGKILYSRIFRLEGKIRELDSFTFTAMLFCLSIYLFPAVTLWSKVIPGTLFSVILFMQRKRIVADCSWLPVLLSGAVLLEPYYTVLRNVEIPGLFTRELYVLPWVGLVIFAAKILKGKYRKLTNRLQWAVLIIVSLMLVQDGLASNTVYDALIVGTLSLVSMLAGTFYRIKSYFFVGSGVLLLNVLLQTKPYWGNLPWWVYLLLAGSLLITTASYNEWKKQKTARGEETLLSQWKNSIVRKWRDWQ